MCIYFVHICMYVCMYVLSVCILWRIKILVPVSIQAVSQGSHGAKDSHRQDIDTLVMWVYIYVCMYVCTVWSIHDIWISSITFEAYMTLRLWVYHNQNIPISYIDIGDQQSSKNSFCFFFCMCICVYVFADIIFLTASLDREVDLVSPLVTPLTYEGLMDEIIGITNSTVRLDSSVLG